jgi:hypothetical protein
MFKRVLALVAVTAALVIPSAAPAAAASAPVAQSGRSADNPWPNYWSAYSNHQTEGHCVGAGEIYRSQEWWHQYYCAYEPDPGRPFEDWTLYIYELYTQS